MVLNYILDIIFSIYNRLIVRPFYNYSCYKTVGGMQQLDEIKKDLLYVDYKKDRSRINKTIFALNNMPEVIHTVLFKNSNYLHICPKYFQMYYELNDNNKFVKKYANLTTLQVYLDDNALRYIYIRINLIENNKKNDHVNSIIIDKKKKYILYFEPQCELRLIQSSIINDINIYGLLYNYNFLIPADIGYSFINKLQRFDSYCQTYVLYTFCLVIENSEVDPKDYSDMFNSIISRKDGVISFLYYVDTCLRDAGITLNNNEYRVGELEEVELDNLDIGVNVNEDGDLVI